MLRFFVFVAGAVLMSLEILGSRVLAPHYGNSIIVWGSLIGTFLGALSAGYWLGGRVADRLPKASVIGSLVAAAGAYVILIPAAAPFVFRLAGDSLRAGSLAASAALFFIPSVLLGAVSPYAIRLQEAEVNRLGRAAGGLYALSTLGSILGTVTTAFWLVPLAGVPTLIRMLGGILIFVAGTLVAWSMPSVRLTRVLAMSATGLVVVIGGGLLVAQAFERRMPHAVAEGEKVIYEKDTFYHHILVTDAGDIRELRFDDSHQSAIYKSRPLESPYRYFEYLNLGRVFAPDARDVLVAGLGGGVVARRYLVELPQARIDCVDIDPEVISVARRFFGFPESHPRLRSTAEDGRRFLEKTDRLYDIIVLDVFNRDTLPFHMVTKEFYALCRSKLKPNGIIAVNMIGTVRGAHSGLFASVYQTIGSAFSERYVFTQNVKLRSLDDEIRNCIIIAGTRTKMSDAQVAEAFAEARRHGVKERTLRHEADYLSREPDLYLARTLSDDYAPVDDLISFSRQ